MPDRWRIVSTYIEHRVVEGYVTGSYEAAEAVAQHVREFRADQTEGPVVTIEPAPSGQPDGIHTIPVPRGMSVEQAWENIVRGVALTDPTPAWANVEVRDGRIVRVLPARLTPAPFCGREATRNERGICTCYRAPCECELGEDR
jgi:hypothetical protein